MIVTPDNTGYFLHGTDYEGGPFPGPMPDENVYFELQWTPKGRRAVACKQVRQ